MAAAMRRAPTGPAMAGDHVNVPLALGLAAAAPSHQTPIRGGVPLIVDGQVHRVESGELLLWSD